MSPSTSGRPPASNRPAGFGHAKLRSLPSVDRLLHAPALEDAVLTYPRPLLLHAIREALDAVRHSVANGGALPADSELIAAVLTRVAALAGGALRPVINATGVIVHTNLGRAPLSEEAIAAMAAVSTGYSNLEFDLDAGERGSRHTHVSDLLCRLTGAEAAVAVNNNAAAVLLALTALAQGKEVVIARGQLVEIGGGFRVPDVMRQSGARLVEVGTTNRTYAADYEAAVTAETALLLRVHTSNFRVIGFTHETELAELAAVAERHNLVVMDDLGSGALLDTARYGLAHEPTPQESVAAGAGIVCFSGDKLLGGPQAGLIVGKAALVERVKRHPLARAVRLDKASIAGLQATLLHYLKDEASAKVPVWRMISQPLAELDRRAHAIAASLRDLGLSATVVDARSTIGGGSLPGETLPARAVSIPAPSSSTASSAGIQDLAALLRRQRPALIGRLEHDALILDPRTVLPEQDELIVEALRHAISTLNSARPSSAGV